MKTKLLILLLTIAGVPMLSAQTADAYVTQGRSYLAATNIVAANNSFSNAVALSPNDQVANVFYAATRLLVLPNQPAISNFLSRIGLPQTNRNIYNWRAKPVTDANGIPFVPPGLNAREFTEILRTNILQTLIAADANLAKVIDTNFTLLVKSNETRIAEVTLDYGDVLMLRAMLKAAEYLTYTIYSWNLDAQLDMIRYLYDTKQLSIERVLMDYPSLLTFATTNDLDSARQAFIEGVSLYMKASQFIRSRSTNVTRLFNYDAGKADDEEKFRLTLIDLTNSLVSAVTLNIDTNYTVFLGSHFNGKHSPRSLIPTFRGNGYVLGTIPDVTFGGLIYGLTNDMVEMFITRYLSPVPSIYPFLGTFGEQFQFNFNVAKGRGYVIQVSTNLLNWSDYSAFVALEGRHQFTDNAAGFARRFYRLVDRTGNMPPPANDLFENRAVITKMNSPVTSYTYGASREPFETNWSSWYYGGHTIWWTWTSPLSGDVAVVTTGGEADYAIIIFTGSSISDLNKIAEGWGCVRFNAQAGVTYQLSVQSCWFYDGGVKLVITRPPSLLVVSPPDGASFIEPANITLSASASDPDGQIKEMTVFAYPFGGWPGLDFKTTSNTFSLQWTNVASGKYYIQFSAKDDSGAEERIVRYIEVRPHE